MLNFIIHKFHLIAIYLDHWQLINIKFEYFYLNVIFKFFYTYIIHNCLSLNVKIYIFTILMINQTKTQV